MRFLVVLALAVSAAFFVVCGAAQAQFGQTFTVPQCVSAAAGQDLLADGASPDDCLFGTTGGPFAVQTAPPPSHLLLLNAGGHILLNSGGLLCNAC